MQATASAAYLLSVMVAVLVAAAWAVGQALPVELIPANLWALALLVAFAGVAFRYLYKRLRALEAREREIVDRMLAARDEEIARLRRQLEER